MIFFGLGHGITKNYTSAALMMSPEDGKSLNCFLPMPFASHARIEVENESLYPVRVYFYVDYEEYDDLDDNELRFHAQWNSERLTGGIDDFSVSNEDFSFGGKYTTGSENYVILDAVGSGHYVGCNLNIHNQRFTDKWNWYGEGDDMIFIDGEVWPPSLHGTGMEDYFNTAWCPTQEVCTPYHGIILGGGPNWSCKISMYRYHIEDPIVFSESIRVTIEHGHNNNRSDDYSSTAYWYQTEPYRTFPRLLLTTDFPYLISSPMIWKTEREYTGFCRSQFLNHVVSSTARPMSRHRFVCYVPGADLKLFFSLGCNDFVKKTLDRGVVSVYAIK